MTFRKDVLRHLGIEPGELKRAAIYNTLVTLLDTANVIVNRPVVDAELMTLKDGGDFADGLSAYEGRWLGGETFVSFDKKAVALVAKQGHPALLLSA